MLIILAYSQLVKQIKNQVNKTWFFGADRQIRTADLFITSEPLYRLSHISILEVALLILEVRVARGTRKRYYVADILHTRHIHY